MLIDIKITSHNFNFNFNFSFRCDVKHFIDKKQVEELMEQLRKDIYIKN